MAELLVDHSGSDLYGQREAAWEALTGEAL